MIGIVWFFKGILWLNNGLGGGIFGVVENIVGYLERSVIMLGWCYLFVGEKDSENNLVEEWRGWICISES